MIRDMFGNTIEKDSMIMFALSTGALILGKVDHVPVGLHGEPPFVMVSLNQIPLPVQQGNVVPGIMVVNQPQDKSKLIEG